MTPKEHAEHIVTNLKRLNSTTSLRQRDIYDWLEDAIVNAINGLSVRLCDDCFGRGWVPTSLEYKACPSCNGTGTIKEY